MFTDIAAEMCVDEGHVLCTKVRHGLCIKLYTYKIGTLL